MSIIPNARPDSNVLNMQVAGVESLSNATIDTPRPAGAWSRAIFAGVLAFDAAMVIVSVAWAFGAGHRVNAAFDEGGPVTAFSSMQLAAVAGLSLMIFHARRARESRLILRSPCWLWVLIALGFAALALDEAAAVHEWIDHQIHARLGLRENPWTDRIDDLIVLCCGLVGLATLWIYRRELARFRSAWPMLALAMTLFFAMVAMDLLTNSYSISAPSRSTQNALKSVEAWANVAEESLKVASEAALIATFATIAMMSRRLERREV